MLNRKYRSRLEVLRDLLVAAREGSRKTRIMNRANLNPSSFQKYVDFCLDHELLETQGGRYVTTARANEVLVVVEEILERTSQLEAALGDLEQIFGECDPDEPVEGRHRFLVVMTIRRVGPAERGEKESDAAARGPGLGHPAPIRLAVRR